MGGSLRTVNLELGQPAVRAAIRQLQIDLTSTRKMGCAALKIIHGYGSSGTGGKIRTAARRELAQQKQAGRLRDVIYGEHFTIFEESTRTALRLCPDLRRDSDLERYNNGVTFVLF